MAGNGLLRTSRADSPDPNPTNLANLIRAGLTDDVNVPSTIRPRMPELLPALWRTLPEAGASPVGAVGVSQMGQDGGMQARCTPDADVV